MRRTKQDLARFVVKSFQGMGFKVNPSGRIMRQHNLLLNGNVDIDFGTKDFFFAIQALRDLQMLGFIFDQKNDFDDPEFRDLVGKCLSDHPLSEMPAKQTPGRDSQFELYVAAACKQAGLLPVKHCNPDVIFSIGNFPYCIAAKRPKTVKGMDGCLRDACNQIAEKGLPGIIVIDTSLAFAFEQFTPPVPELDDVWELMRHWQIHLKPIDDRTFAQVHTMAMNMVIGKFKETMDRRMAGKAILGIVFDNQMTRIFADGEWGLTGGSITYPTSDGPRFEVVAGEFLRGMPGQEGQP